MSLPADGRRAGGAEEGAERRLAPEVVQQLVQAVALVGRDLVPEMTENHSDVITVLIRI